MGRDRGSSRKHRNYSSSDGDDDDRRRRKKSSSKRITEQEIMKVCVEKEDRKIGISSGSIDEISVKSEKRRIKERMAEIEKVKKRREERAIEKAQHEEEMAMLAGERARAEFQDWEKKEEEFHFDQSKIRSGIRLCEGRIKPIDILSKHLDDSDDFEFEIDELDKPHMVFQGLTDIRMHLDLDRATPTHIDRSSKRDALDRARVRGEQPPAELLAEERGLHSSIREDVKKLLHGKTYKELEVLQTQIGSQMRSGTAKVVEYWEAVVKRLHIFKAKACLKEIHTNLLRKHLRRLQIPMKSENILEDVHDDPKPQFEEDIMHDVEDPGSYSPKLIMKAEEDRIELERKSQAVKEEHKRRLQEAMASKSAPVDENWELMANKVMGDVVDGDAVFGSGAEVNLDSQYNQTHYDHDSPPPKIVQGYKFNIFYPDHVDKTKAITYTIEKVEGNNGETCFIKFHAGPPYEDIAFKIVNKEWEYSHKKGFKCTFETRITCPLQLQTL
ncbi:hypothetical protein MKX01_030196 [Papaver californicum]|nr:hypothetical protein MKX01_030196 [Papaver californicum]